MSSEDANTQNEVVPSLQSDPVAREGSTSPVLNQRKPPLFQKLVFVALVIAIGYFTYWVVSYERSDNPQQATVFSPTIEFGEAVDDWEYEAQEQTERGSLAPLGFSGVNLNSAAGIAAPAALMDVGKSGNIGFSTGGAKDINNFRENIKNGYLPIASDVSYEGLFYDYFFDTGELKECFQLFCPSYSYALTKDPFSGEDEHYLAVGLNSGVKESDFQRKKLNLVVVLDISGSMGSPFNQYYYDQSSNVELSEDEQKSKMMVANESVVALLDHLNPDDRFGMVLFDDQAYLAKPLRYIGETQLDEIKDHILDITDHGGTNMESGMSEATGLFDIYKNVDQTQYENRIIFLTDAMPNTGNITEGGLLGMVEENERNSIYTTFIGIGVDFNSELTEAITKVRGANYYSVHSSKEFKNRMDQEFEYMVTPLVFDLLLKLESDGWDIEKVYGSPEADQATGEIMKVKTLFPSKKSNDETKGGLVLLKLKRKVGNSDLKLSVSYKDRAGKSGGETVVARINDKPAEFFENSGIRKGILLVRYANLLKHWINDERKSQGKPELYVPSISRLGGIDLPSDSINLGDWERRSLPLKISNPYPNFFSDFASYFRLEMDAIGDESLQKEQKVLELLQ